MKSKKILVKPTKDWIEADLLIAIGSILDNGKNWTLNTETRELKNPFEKIITNYGNRMLEIGYLKIIEEGD